jgi:hypothetical protein
MSLIHRRTRARSHPQKGGEGQTLVEFALVFPLFLLLLFGVIEFAFVFSGMLGISYATRDAALLAAEAGNADGADCVIIQAVDTALTPPAADNRITAVIVYRADQNGVEMAGVSNRWTRGGSTDCGGGLSIPYVRQTNGYPETSRCNVLAGDVGGGCETGHPGLDTIGVRVEYAHQWVTPLGGFGGNGFGGQGGTGFTLSQSNSMRMEPIL